MGALVSVACQTDTGPLTPIDEQSLLHVAFVELAHRTDYRSISQLLAEFPGEIPVRDRPAVVQLAASRRPGAPRLRVLSPEQILELAANRSEFLYVDFEETRRDRDGFTDVFLNIGCVRGSDNAGCASGFALVVMVKKSWAGEWRSIGSKAMFIDWVVK